MHSVCIDVCDARMHTYHMHTMHASKETEQLSRLEMKVHYRRRLHVTTKLYAYSMHNIHVHCIIYTRVTDYYMKILFHSYFLFFYMHSQRRVLFLCMHTSTRVLITPNNDLKTTLLNWKVWKTTHYDFHHSPVLSGC